MNFYRAVVDVAGVDGGRRQITKARFRTLTEARQWVDQTRADVRARTYVAPTPVTVRDLHQRWLASKIDVRERTRYGYESDFKPVARKIGSLPAQSITYEVVYDLLEWLAAEGGVRGQGLGHRSVESALAILKQVLQYGVRTGVLRTSPAIGVKPPRVSKTERAKAEVDPWTPAELRAFVKAADKHEWAHAWRLVACGLRRSEVCGLKWTDVDVATGAVTIRRGRVAVGGKKSVVDDTKSRASERTVHVETIHAGSAALLKAAYLAAADKEGFVLTDALGTPPHPDTVTSVYKRLIVGAGLRYIRPHAHRHTIALIAHLNGVAPVDAAAFLGHSLLVHLTTYLKPYLDGTEHTAKAIGAALAAGT